MQPVDRKGADSLNSFSTCFANSRVGARTKTRGNLLDCLQQDLDARNDFTINNKMTGTKDLTDEKTLLQKSSFQEKNTLILHHESG